LKNPIIEQYKPSRRKDKQPLSQFLVNTVREWGGRFLKMDDCCDDDETNTPVKAPARAKTKTKRKRKRKSSIEPQWYEAQMTLLVKSYVKHYEVIIGLPLLGGSKRN
jgi:hypothetical protein